jgi:hypothetical protein
LSVDVLRCVCANLAVIEPFTKRGTGAKHA